MNSGLIDIDKSDRGNGARELSAEPKVLLCHVVMAEERIRHHQLLPTDAVCSLPEADNICRLPAWQYINEVLEPLSKLGVR